MKILDSYYVINGYSGGINRDYNINISEESEVTNLLDKTDFLTFTKRHKFKHTHETYNIRAHVSKSHYDHLVKDNGKTEAIEIIMDSILFAFERWDKIDSDKKPKIYTF